MTAPENNRLDAATALRVLGVARRLTQPFELADLLSHVVDASRELLGAERGSVFLYDPTMRELYTVVATGATGIRLSIETGIAGQCARDRRTIRVEDCYRDPRFNRETDVRTGYHTRSLITVPLIGLDSDLVGVMQLLNPNKPHFEASDEPLAEALASLAAAAIQHVRLLNERMTRMKLERDLAIARDIQRRVLPQEAPSIPGYDIASYNEPTDQTGGDMYDFIATDAAGNIVPAQPASSPAALWLTIADASGHGIGPALSVTQVRAMLRIALRLGTSIDATIRHINEQLSEDLDGRRFVTAFLGRLDLVNHRVDYHAAGQGPLLHYRAATRDFERCRASAVPLGVMPDALFEPPAPFVLEPGDWLVLLTDGFFEAMNAQKKLMGEERIMQVIAASAHLTSAQMLSAILEATRAFVAGAPQGDDMTALLIRRLP